MLERKGSEKARVFSVDRSRFFWFLFLSMHPLCILVFSFLGPDRVAVGQCVSIFCIGCRLLMDAKLHYFFMENKKNKAPYLHWACMHIPVSLGRNTCDLCFVGIYFLYMWPCMLLVGLKFSIIGYTCEQKQARRSSKQTGFCYCSPSPDEVKRITQGPKRDASIEHCWENLVAENRNNSVVENWRIR